MSTESDPSRKPQLKQLRLFPEDIPDETPAVGGDKFNGCPDPNQNAAGEPPPGGVQPNDQIRESTTENSKRGKIPKLYKCHGGKEYQAKRIQSQAPPSVHDDPERGYTHRNIVFAGGLGEFWNWHPIVGISEAINDKNGNITNLYAVVRDHDSFREFQRLVSLTPFSEDEFARSRQKLANPGGSSTVERAVHLFISNRLSRQGLGKDYATPTRRTRRGMSEHVSAYLSTVDGLPECHERLRRVEIRNLDFRKFIPQYDHPRALFYLDPPYLFETRSSTGEYGAYEMSAEDHADLLQILADIEGRFMLSGYHSELYDSWAKEHGWNCRECEIDNKASSAKKKEKRTECLWTNY